MTKMPSGAEGELAWIRSWPRSFLASDLGTFINPNRAPSGGGMSQHGRHRTGFPLAPAPAVLPRRRGRREPHALGAPARRQGLLRHGPAPAGVPGDALHHQSGAEPAACSSRPTPSTAPRDRFLDVVPAARRRSERERRPLPARPLLHGQRGQHDPAVSALRRAVPAPRPRPQHGPRGACAASTSATSAICRSGSTSPGSTPSPSSATRTSASLRDKGRHFTEEEKNWLLDKQLEILRADHAAAPATGRGRPGRADDDAVLPSDPAAAVRQEAGPRGHARGQAAALHGRLSRGRRPPRAPGHRAPRRRSSASRRAACGRPRARSARPCCRCWRSTASAGSPPTRRS